MAPIPITAYLSIDPLEPVLVFRTPEDAKDYQTYQNGLARIYRDKPSSVFLPMPPGLSSVRTARRGNVAFEFKSAMLADEFERVIRVGGRRPVDRLHADERYSKTVYVGLEIVRRESAYPEPDFL